MVLFKAACLEADIINENNRIYSYETMNNINSSIQQSIKEGNIKHYGYDAVENYIYDSLYQSNNLKGIEAFRILDSKIENNKLWVLGETISRNISGQILENFIQQNLSIYIVTNGTGNVNLHNQIEDYELICFTYTHDSSFLNLHPAKIINDINEFNVYNKKQDEFKVYIKELIDEIVKNDTTIN